MMSDISDSVVCAAYAHARDLPESDGARPNIYEINVYSFPQGWGSTALGFGGFGGQGFTIAQTTVVVHDNNAAVYFGRQLAYVIRDFNSTLLTDVAKLNMAEVSKSHKYRK